MRSPSGPPQLGPELRVALFLLAACSWTSTEYHAVGRVSAYIHPFLSAVPQDFVHVADAAKPVARHAVLRALYPVQLSEVSQQISNAVARHATLGKPAYFIPCHPACTGPQPPPSMSQRASSSGRGNPPARSVVTPRDRHLHVSEVEAYMKFLARHIGKSRDTRRELEDCVQTSRSENKRLEDWLERGQPSKVPYLLSLIDESRYDPRNEADRLFLERLDVQRQTDARLRRELKPHTPHKS